MYVSSNNLNNKNLFINKFHTSSCLLSDKDKVKSDISNLNVDEETLRTKISELKVDEPDLTNNSSEFIPGGEELQKSLSDFKEIRSQTIFSEDEVKTEYNRFEEYIQNHPEDFSSYSEAFPDLVNKQNTSEFINYAKTTDLINDSDSDVSKKEESFESVKLLFAELKKCVDTGNYSENCFSKIKLSSLINNFESTYGSAPTEAKEAAVAKIVKESLDKANNITETIKEIKLGELYETYLKVRNQVPFDIKPSYLELGFNLVGYGLLLRSYNKFVHNRPISPSITGAELEVIHATRTISRF